MRVYLAGWLALLPLLIGAVVPLSAATVPPPPDPGLAASLRAADVIAEVEILAGGPFRAAASVRRVYRGQPPRVLELAGYNTLNWDATNAAFETGSRWILFLSATGQPDTFVPLTPNAPRLAVKDGSVLLSLGDPPFRLPVPEADLSAALERMAGPEASGANAERGMAFLRELWDRNEVEPRYLATALAGWLRDARAVPLLAEAARDKLLRLRLVAVESLSHIAAPEALVVLRSLLKDERDLVAREAAVALIDARDAAAVPELLDWARRAAEAKSRLPQDDSRRKKSAQYINQLLLMLLDLGPLLPRESFVDGLLTLAHSPDGETATTALFILDRLAGKDEIDRLLALAEDPVYPQAKEAAPSLFRASLRPTVDLKTFRAWWLINRDRFGEEAYVKRVRESAVGLAFDTGDDLPGELLGVLISAPPEVVLPEIAHLLLDERGHKLLEVRHVAVWRGPLTLPFLIERLGSSDARDRALALQTLAVTLRGHPRLAVALLPLVRAHLADPDPLVRRMACSACGLLGDAAAFPWLLQALRGSVSYEANEAAQAVFDLSARTLGYAYHELAEDNDVAVKRLGAWWDQLGEQGRSSWRSPILPNGTHPPFGDAAKLEALLTGRESRAAGAAFALLLAERPATDGLWLKVLKSERVRDRAHGVLGLFGAPASAATDLARVLKTEGAGADLPRALSMPVLASLKGGRGPDLLIEWLEGPGATAALPWRHLAIVSLGLAEGEPRSLAWLQKAMAAGLAVETDPDAFPVEVPPPAAAVLQSVLLALAARTDGASVLAGALKSRSPVRREWAMRTLALRNHVAATADVLAAMDKADRYAVGDLARAVMALPQAGQAEAMAEYLLNGSESGRLGVAAILAKRPELGALSVLRGALVQALQDTSTYVRARAVECLGRMRAKSALPTLVQLLNDFSTEVRSAVIEALGRIGDRPAAQAAATELHRYTRVDPRSMPVLGLSDEPEDLRQLLTAAQSESWIERRGAFQGLALSRSPEAQNLLLAVFHDLRSPYRTHAGEALARQGAPALKALTPDFTSEKPAVRAAALFWLDDLSGAKALALELEALRDQEAGIRQLADWLLRRKTGKDAGFDTRAPEGQREESIKRWRAIVEGVKPGP